MAKTLKDIIGNRAGRKIPGKEAEYLDQHKVDEVPATYVVKDVAVGVKGINDPKNEGLVQSYISGSKNKRAEVHKDSSGDYHVKKFDAAGPNGKLVTTKSYSDASTAHSIAKAHLSEDEELNELSSGTLRGYLSAARSDKKSSDSLAHHAAEKATSNPKLKDHNGYARKEIAQHTFKAAAANSRKRAKGMNTATSKLARRDPVESVEPVNELSLDTLRSYRRKSNKEYMQHHSDRYLNNNTSDDNRKSMDKRMRGGWKAQSKIMVKKGFTNKGGKWVKEEEQLDEVKRNICNRTKIGIPCPKHGMKNCFALCEDDQVDEKMYLSKGRGVASILADKHTRLADKHLYKDDPEGSKEFHKHARAANRYSRIAKGKPPFSEDTTDENEYQDTSAMLREDWDAMSHEAKELVLHGDNVQHLNSHSHVVNVLYRKNAAGVYNHEKAKKLWKYHADNVARDYAKTHSYAGGKDWHKLFSPAHRNEVASHYADRARDTHGFGKTRPIKEETETKSTLVKTHYNNNGGKNNKSHAEVHKISGYDNLHVVRKFTKKGLAGIHSVKTNANDAHDIARKWVNEETVEEVWNVVHNKKVIHTSPDAASAYRCSPR